MKKLQERLNEKDDYIELQGDYTSKIREVLVGLGFPSETIEVKKTVPKAPPQRTFQRKR